MVSSTSYIEKSRYVLISEFALSLSEATGLDALKTDVIPKLKYIIDFNSCTLALLNEDESSYRLLNLLETRQKMSRTATERLPLDSGIHGNVILNGEPHIYSDQSWESAEIMEVVDPSLAGSSLNSIMCLSLQVGGKVFGSIAFGTNQNVDYTHADINIASTIAAHLSLAIDRWNMIEKLSTANEEVQRLNVELEERVVGRTADLRKEINEHRQTESALRKSEERYRSLYTKTPVMLHSIDVNGRFRSVSDYWLKTLGYERNEVIGQPLTSFLTEAARQRVENVYLPTFMKTGVLIDTPLQFEKKNGEIVDVLLSAIAERDIDNNFVRSLAVSIDVTQRKQAQEALAQLQRQHELILKTAAEGIYGLDTAGKTTFVNPAAAEMLGWNVEALVGQPMHALLHHSRPDGSPYPAAECPIYATFKDGKGHRVDDEVFWRKDASSFPVEYTSKPIFEDGKLAGAVVVFRDVTERKRAEEAVKRYTKRLETLQEIDRAVLAARSPQTIAQAALGQIRELVSCERASVAVFDFESGGGRIIAVDSQSETELNLGSRFLLDAFWKIDALREGAVHSVEDATQLPDEPYGRMLRDEGMRSWINVPLIAQDELIGSLNLGSDRVNTFSSEDIDAVREVANSLAIAIHQAHLHDQVQRQTVELEQRVTERTAELEAFSYSVSHDLRAPLRAIDGFSRVLLEDYSDKLDPECNRLLNVICANANNMGQLIDDLLAFSRLGRQEMKLTDIDMGELTRGVSNELVSDPRAEVRIGMLPPARGDPAMIRQVLVNLLSNGIKFTQPKNTSRIEIGHRNGNNENTYYVKDNGVGFDMRYVEKIFGVFQRLHGADEFEGTGVGLAIVQSIIQRHGGRVWAEGKINQGATIYFTLPPGATKE